MNAGVSGEILDGFWLPQPVRAGLPEALPFHVQTFRQGRPARAGEPGAVSARWPILGAGELSALLNGLVDARRRSPRGEEFWKRFQAALRYAGKRMADPSDPLHRRALAALPGYTGYAPEMIAMALHAIEWFALEGLPAACACPPDRKAVRGWQAISGAPGWVRFFPQSPWQRLINRLPGTAGGPLFEPPGPPGVVVGYGAGNVPGAALLIGLLASAATGGAGEPAAVILRNSRREPIFTPLVFSAMEQADPDLMASTATLVWDYEDRAAQDALLSRADLVIAAASDETIEQLRGDLQRAGGAGRLHAHGHKASFTLIGREMLERSAAGPDGEPRLETAARLAALDSIFWDQNGCLSARVHFVEEAPTQTHQSAADYAGCLVAELRRLQVSLPRGAWPLGELHARFDRYKQLEAGGQVQVLSAYDDAFLVFVDRRPLDGAAFRGLVNDCRGRTVAIRPVRQRMEVPDVYLKQMPRASLQSLSVAVGRPGQPVDADFLDFAEACAARGVTAIRSAGRGAFPQLAYSWDGYLPHDIVARRPDGYFSTIEFDNPGLDAPVEAQNGRLNAAAAGGIQPA